jgi:hypothetical protein
MLVVQAASQVSGARRGSPALWCLAHSPAHQLTHDVLGHGAASQNVGGPDWPLSVVLPDLGGLVVDTVGVGSRQQLTSSLNLVGCAVGDDEELCRRPRRRHQGSGQVQRDPHRCSCCSPPWGGRGELALLTIDLLTRTTVSVEVAGGSDRIGGWRVRGRRPVIH